jgi:hypothetical protein
VSSITLKIVAERPDDTQLIRTMLHKALPASTRFFATRRQVSLVTIGRNLLVDEGGPVLLVMDADTLSPQLRDERQSLAMFAMSRVATPDQFQVFSFVPEIEVVFFEACRARAGARDQGISSHRRGRAARPEEDAGPVPD